MQDEINYFGGVTNKVDLYDQGDKLMVLFGAPMAHERDARRAALTALAMQSAMQRLMSPQAAAFLRQRIGIHSGYVFAGNLGSVSQKRREYTVMGDTVNLAARLMSAASEDGVLVSHDVWTQIAGEFEVEELPPIPLKGIARPVPVYELLEHQLGNAAESRIRPRLSPMVGRSSELNQLVDLQQDVAFGLGKRMVAIIGEGGVGKTRLLSEWRGQLDGQDTESPTWLSGHAHDYGQRPYALIIEILEQLLGIESSDQPAVRWRRLSRFLHGHQLEQSERREAYLGHLLGLDLSMRRRAQEHVDQLDPDSLRAQTWVTIADLLEQVADSEPLTIVLEDLHWADEGSLQLLEFLIDKVPDQASLLFCLVFRSEKERPVWSMWLDIKRRQPGCVELVLNELDRLVANELLSNLLETDKTVDPNLLRLIHRETDGNPLYIEEVIRHLTAEGLLFERDGLWQLSHESDRIVVPDSLYQIIQSRIDDLDFQSPGARRVLWLAAVLGTEAPMGTLRTLFEQSGRLASEFAKHLRALRNADMLEPERVSQPGQQLPGYRFRHGLVQQVAYENMSRRSRRAYHRDVGNWLEQQYEGQLTPVLSQLAYHYDRADETRKAFRYHFLAGQQAAAQYANVDAVTHLVRATELAARPEAGALPLEMADCRFLLGQVLVRRGAFSEALITLGAADAVYAGLGITGLVPRARVALEIGHLHEKRGDDLDSALSWQSRGLSYLPEVPTVEEAKLYVLGGMVSLRQGNWQRVVRQSEQALNAADSSGSIAAEAVAHRLLGVYWHAQGDLEQALSHGRRDIVASDEIDDSLGLIKAFLNQGVYAFESDDWAAAETAYLQAVDLLERVNDQHELSRAYCNLADLYVHLGDLEQADRYANQTLRIATEMRAAPPAIIAHAVQAIVYWRQERFDEAMVALDAAEPLVENLPFFAPTIGRWRAEILLSQGQTALASEVVQPFLEMDLDVLADEREPLQRLRARLFAADGEGQAAEALLQASLVRSQEAGLNYQSALTQLTLAELFKSNRQWDAARQEARAASDILKQLGASLDFVAAERLLNELPPAGV